MKNKKNDGLAPTNIARIISIAVCPSLLVYGGWIDLSLILFAATWIICRIIDYSNMVKQGQEYEKESERKYRERFGDFKKEEG